MILRDINKKIVIAIAIVIGVIVSFTRITYATFTIYKESSSEVLEFGQISMTVCPNNTCQNNGNIIGTYNSGGNKAFIAFYPIQDPNIATYPTGWENVNRFVFTIENSGDLDLSTTIFLEPDTTATNQYSSLSIDNGSGAGAMTQTFTGFVNSTQYKYFKVAIIEESTGGIITTNNIKTYDTVANTNHVDALATTPNKLLNLDLEAGESKTFYLYMWLSDNALSAGSATDLTAGSSTSGIVGTNDILGKYLVTQIWARGEYKPATN